MNGNSLLFDTTAAIDFLKKSEALSEVLIGAERLYLPLVALGELEYGARYSSQVEKHLNAIANLLRETMLVYPDRSTATLYGTIKASLRQKGKPIPDNDIWIAAMARQLDIPLVARDSHFSEVDELVVLSW